MQIPRSLKQVFMLASGTVLAQFIIIAGTPAVTRIFEPTAMGNWALYLAVVYTFSTLAGFRYDGAVVAAPDDHVARSLITGAAIVAAIVAVTAFVAIATLVALRVIPAADGGFFGAASANGFVLFCYNLRCSELNRNEQYGPIAKSRILMAVAQCAVQIAGGLIVPHAYVLMAGTLIGHILGTISVNFAKSTPQLGHIRLRDPGIRQELKRNWRMPVFNGLNTVADQARTNGLNFGVALIYSTSQLGQFSLSWRIMLLPTSLIGAAVAAVYYRRFASTSGVDLVAEVRSCIKLTVATALIPFAILAFAGTSIFRIIFGQEWAMAGSIAEALAPLGFVMFVSSALSPLFIVTKKQWQSAVMSVLLLTPLALLLLGDRDIVAFSAAYGVFMAVILVIYSLLAVLAAKRST